MSDRNVKSFDDIKTSFLESLCDDNQENWSAFMTGAAELKKKGLSFVESFRMMAEWIVEANLVDSNGQYRAAA